MNSIQLLPKLISQFVRDEFSAAAMYLREANELPPSIAKELREHAGDEFSHADKLLAFAYAHGFGADIVVAFDDDVVNYSGQDFTSILDKVQALELKAIDDYTRVARIANRLNLIEVADLFLTLAAEERQHFDDFAVLLNQVRPIT